jgi:hypothetical protein
MQLTKLAVFLLAGIVAATPMEDATVSLSLCLILSMEAC